MLEGCNLAGTICRKPPLDSKVIFPSLGEKFPTALVALQPMGRHHLPFLHRAAGRLRGSWFKGMVKYPGLSLEESLMQRLLWTHRSHPTFSLGLGTHELFPLGNRRMRKGRHTIQPHIPTSWYSRDRWREAREVPGAADNSRQGAKWEDGLALALEL